MSARRAFTDQEREAIVQAFVAASLWTATVTGDEGGTEYLDADTDEDDLPDDVLTAMRSEAREFVRTLEESAPAHVVDDYLAAVAGDVSHIGHDFALTREGHGAGFWDRGTGEAGERLTTLAKGQSGEGLMAFLHDDGTVGYDFT